MPEWDTLRLPRTVVADETARLALTGQTEDDVGRVYRQTDDSTYWMLVSIGPNTWRQVLGTELVITEAQFSDPGADPSHSAGLVYWRGDNLNLMTSVSGVVRQLGEELQIAAKNTTGAQIDNGDVVRISGAQGNKTLIALATNVTAEGAHAAAVATADIADGANGYVTTFGVVRDLDTSSWVEGTELFLGVDGALVGTRPTGYARVLRVGWVLYQHPTAGEILVDMHEHPTSSFQVGLMEARPLSSSSSFSNLDLWAWTDEKFPAITGQSNQTDWTVEEYRDTGQLKVFFRHDQDNELHGDVQMSHEWAGTTVHLHVHTLPMANGSGNVYWEGAYFFGNRDDVIPAASGWTALAATQTLASGDQYTRQYFEIADDIAPPANPSASAILSFRLARMGDSPNDTYTTNKDHGTGAANIGIESYDVHYQRLLGGSSEEASGRTIVNPTDLWMTTSVGGNLLVEGHIYLQLGARSRDGNEVEFQVYDVDAAAAVSDPVTLTSATYQVVQLGPVTMGDGPRHLRVQGRYTGTADEPIVGIVRLIAK